MERVGGKNHQYYFTENKAQGDFTKEKFSTFQKFLLPKLHYLNGNNNNE